LFSFSCPESLSNISLDSANSLYIDGSYSYVGGKDIFEIIDISVLPNPKKFSSINIPDNLIYDIFVYEDYGFCAGTKGLIIINLKDKKNLKVESEFSGSYTFGIAYYSNIVYLCSSKNGLSVIDVSDKKNPKFIKFVDGIAASYKAMVEGRNLFVAGGNSLYILNLDNPKDPKIVSSISDYGIEYIKKRGNIIFSCGFKTVYSIFDISDLSNPKLITSKYELENYINWNALEILNDVLFVSSNSETRIYDIYDLKNIFQIGEVDNNLFNDMKQRDGILFGAAWHPEHALKIYTTQYCYHNYFSPNASFSYSPINPVKGEKVFFTDTSYPYATNWLWDFGDGEEEKVKNPYHIFLKSGEVEVKLSSSNPSGSSTSEKKIYISEGQPAPPFTESGKYKYLVPAAAHKIGANGTFWVTDLQIISKANQSGDVYIYFIPQDGGSCDYEGVRVALDSTQFINSIRINDIVYKIFQDDKAGALFVTSDFPLIVNSRTYNIGKGEGTYGQFVPSFDLTEVENKEKIVILPMAKQNEDFRVNIGFVNTGNKGGNICFVFGSYDSQCSEPFYPSVPFNPCSWNQFSLNEIFGSYINYQSIFQDGYFATYIPENVITYISIIDNKTGDAIFIPEVKVEEY